MNKSVPANEWNLLYEKGGAAAPRYPHDAVVRWFFANYREHFDNKINFLDVGCGGGRHSIFLANLGCNVSAIDYSSNAIDILNLWAMEQNLQIDTKVSSVIELPYAENSFSGIISVGVLCYLNINSIKKSVDEMYRVLMPGGKLFVTTRSNKDSRYLVGNKSTANHAVVAGDKSVPWQSEIGMDMVFLSEEDVEQMFHKFKKINIERESFSMCGRKYLNDDWIITALK